MRPRRDGDTIAKAFEHYYIKPWVNPVKFWGNELKHTAHTLIDPIGHRVGHNRAAADALRQGRPIDAWVAFFVNDMWEASENQTPFAKRFYGIEEKKLVPGSQRKSGPRG